MSSKLNEPEMSEPSQERNPQVKFESRDLSSRGVLGFLVALAIAAVLVHVILWGIYKYVVRQAMPPAATQNPIRTSNSEMRQARGDPQVAFPAPRLQADPIADMNQFRAHEEELLNSYGWVDQANGRVRIPIDEAIGIVAKTGLPTRSPAQAPPMGPKQSAP